MTEHRPLTKGPVEAKLTIADYERLERSGAFERHGRTQLLDGRIYLMNAELRAHGRAKMHFTFALNDALRALGSGLSVCTEGSVRIAPHSLPEPDVAVVEDDGGDGYQPVEDCLLVVEVSDSSLRLDAGKKARIYAAAGVPEYWIVDLKGREVRILTAPGARGYAHETRIPIGQRLVSATVDGLAIETHALA